VNECKEKNRTTTYLNKKLFIRSTFEGLTCAKDLSNDHSFGIKQTIENEMKKLI